MTKTKKITILVSVIACLLTILILGTVFDLQISKTLADLPSGEYFTTNLFAIIGECIGEDILYVLIITACAILFFYLFKNPLKNKVINYICLSVLVLASYLVSLYLFYVTLDNISPYASGVTDYINSTVGKITIFIFPVFIASIIYLLVSRLKPETLIAIWQWALLVLIVAIISNMIVQVSKHIFDRTRFRAMVFSGDEEFSYYTNWFTINKNKFTTSSIYASDFFKSFPSGHTCAATSIFTIVLLPYYFKKLNTKNNKIVLWLVASIYTFLIALSRIIAGAHFFTDVYIAFLITTITIILTFIVMNIIIKKLQSKIAESSKNTENGNESTQQISTTQKAKTKAKNKAKEEPNENTNSNKKSGEN